jgi:micrococcal nuclease
VWLESDISNTDRYDRLLRYVYLAEPPDEPDDEWLRQNMLNAIIVSNKFAVAKRYPPDTKYAELLESL